MLVSMNIPSLQVVVMGKVFSSGNSTLTGTLDFDVTFLEILQYNFFFVSRWPFPSHSPHTSLLL